MKYFLGKLKDETSKVKESIEYFASIYPKVLMFAEYVTTKYSLGDPKVTLIEHTDEDGEDYLVMYLEFPVHYYTEQEEVEDIMEALRELGINVKEFYIDYDIDSNIPDRQVPKLGFVIYPEL